MNHQPPECCSHSKTSARQVKFRSLVSIRAKDFIDAINANQLHGIVVQNPFNMGYLGVKTMVDRLLGKTVERKIDTGVMLVTKENMQSSEVQTLLHPPLDQYLK